MYKSENSLLLNLGLHDVTHSMLSPILSDYNRTNSRDDVFPNRPHPEQPCENLPPVLQVLVRGKDGVDFV